MTTKELLRKGTALAHQGKYSAATEYFQEIVCGDETNVDAWKGLEEAYYKLGKFDKARECAEKVRQLTLVLPTKVQNPAQSNKTATSGGTSSQPSKTSDAQKDKRWTKALIVANVFYLVSIITSIIAYIFASRYIDWFPVGIITVCGLLEFIIVGITPSIYDDLLKGFEESRLKVYYTIATLVCTALFTSFVIIIVDGLSREIKEKNRVKCYREELDQEKKEKIQAVERAKHSEQKQKKLFWGLCFGMAQNEVDSVLNNELPIYIYISTTDSERVSVDTAFFHGELYKVELSSRASLKDLLLQDTGYQKYRMDFFSIFHSDGDSMFIKDNLMVESRLGGYYNTLSYINAPILLAIEEEENKARHHIRIADSIRQDSIRQETLRQRDIERRSKLRLDSINKARFERTR